MEDGKLGKYEIKGTLGKGAMGTVYEGWDPIIRRKVAIKTVRLPDPSDAEAQEEIARFRIEAQAGGRLNHPNICGIFDYGETAEIAYIVMEFIDGRTLKSSLDKEERFPIAETVRIMEGLLAGLQFSHDRQVVHRDIKPANVMLTTDGTVKIADFGIARIEQGHLTQAGAVLGTPAYMSPEQFRGDPVDSRTDLYSSGVVLYQLLTGERPFEGGFSAIMHKALTTEPPLPSELSGTVPLGFDAVVRKAMAKRPDQRYATAHEFAHALRTALEAPAEAAAPVKTEPDWGDVTITANPDTPPPGSTGPVVARGQGWPSTPGQAGVPDRAETDPLATVATGIRGAPVPQPPAPKPVPAPNRLPLIIAAAVVALSAAGGGTWYALSPGSKPQIDPNPPHTDPNPPHTDPNPPHTDPNPPHTDPNPVHTDPNPPHTDPNPPHTDPNPPHTDPNPPHTDPNPVHTDPTPAKPAQPPIDAAAIGGVLANIPCSLVGGAVKQFEYGVRVTGLVHVGQPEMAVRKALADMAPGAPVDWQATSFDGPYCGALDLLRPLAPHFGEPSNGFVLSMAGEQTTLRDGELITLHLTTPDFPAYLQVDYLQHDGSTFHMHPTPTDPARIYPAGSRQSLGDPSVGQARWEVSEPYGTEIITAIASSAQLFAKPRPESETNDAYLHDLQAAIDAAKKKGVKFAVGAVILKTEPKQRQ